MDFWNLLDGGPSHSGPSLDLLSLCGVVPRVPIIVTLPHRFMQPWIKLRKCTIQNHKNHYIQIIHAYFTSYIHLQYTHVSLLVEIIDQPMNQLIIDVM
jgi:hypothetical protein